MKKIRPVAGDFYFGWPKIVISLTLCELLHSMATPAKSSNFCEMLSSIYSSVEAKKHSPAP